MNSNDTYVDPVDYYQERFGIEIEAPPRHYKHRQLKGGYGEAVRKLADPVGLEAGFHTTYTPARFERQFLEEALRGFLERELISDVLSKVKGGKEASVYLCEGTEFAGQAHIAAKVYRPRQFRNLRNDAAYREGRLPLTITGKALNESDEREMRAIRGRTRFGESLRHTSWLMYEYTTIERLHKAGAAVPAPIAAENNAILMAYIGDEQMAAPTLQSVSLAREEAQLLFEVALEQVEIMLREGFIHGDLSAYNILYWQGKITLIDFPQVTLIESNRRAHAILARDIERLCDYFRRQGVEADPQALTEDYWYRYGQDETWAASDFDLTRINED